MFYDNMDQLFLKVNKLIKELETVSGFAISILILFDVMACLEYKTL